MTQAKNTEKYIADNVGGILRRISSSELRARRDPRSVRLLAATKNRSIPEIRAAVAAGVQVIGENKVQELLEKAEHLAGAVEMHFIGHLQRNKVKQVVGLVSLVHSVDSLRVAEEIDLRARSMGIVQNVLIQVNVAGEESKSGIEPDLLIESLRSLEELEGLKSVGLSTIAPYDEEVENVRWVFRKLRELGESCEAAVEGFTCSELSMGMTNDFETAVEEGSTIVRIGTALFGPRTE